MTIEKFYGFSTGDEGDARAWPKYMTARVAAAYCASSPWTVRRHVPPCGRRGRTLIYSIESVEAWMRGEALASPKRNEGTHPDARARASTPNAASLARIRELASPRKRDRADLANDERDVAA